MADDISTVLEQLIDQARAWAAGREYDPRLAAGLRHKAILLNHAHYRHSIPAYRELAEEAGIGGTTDMETLENRLMLSADVFKSYHGEWLSGPDFTAMSRWLSRIYHQPVDVGPSGVSSADAWLDRLAAAGIIVTYSSGTSGAVSFVPRDAATRRLSKTANAAYLGPLLRRRGLISGGVLAGLSQFDAFFLGFRGGRLGNQALMEEMAPLFRRRSFLYDTELTLAMLLEAKKGVYQAEAALRPAYREMIGRISESAAAGRKVFIFGAPFQLRALCRVLAETGRDIPLRDGSLVLFGGGWKSLSGEAVDRAALVHAIASSFSLPPRRVLEGYSMTEISIVLLRCDHGRFHIPPLVEPLLFDEELKPAGTSGTGAFGFLDPLARSYPGFIVSGDHVRMVDGDCACGLSGPALTEIGRTKGQEIKGCGGVMGSLGVG